MRVASAIVLNPKERKQLERMSRARSSPMRVKERAEIILLAADGLENKEITARTGQDKMKVGRWRKRYAISGLAGILKDKTRPGRIKPIPAAKRNRLIKLTIEEKPLGSTHWSRTSMAKTLGVSPSTVGRIWAAHGLKPHRISSFKLSNDKRFQEKIEDIIGLYLNSPENAIVLRRKKPDPSARPHPAWTTHEKRSLPNDDSRLRAQWDYLFIRRHEYPEWRSYWHLHEEASASRVVAVLEPDSPERSKGQGGSYYLRQLLHA